jgi:ubiquinone biosynthesis protein Coq4
MPSNSLGYGLFDYLEKTNLTYKPNLIRHDMKHILLNYEMKMPVELKIHAFLIGNKSYNLMGIIYLIICVIIVPEIIPDLKKEYVRGQNATCLKNIDLQHYIKNDLNETRLQLSIL